MMKRFMCGLLMLISSSAAGQVVLKDEPIGVKPLGYYITAVIDARKDRRPAIGFERYLLKNLASDKSQRPVVMTIRELKLHETPNQTRIEGQVNLVVDFSLQKNYGVEHLVDYRGGLRYVSQGIKSSGVEQHLRSLLTASIVHLNEWMKTNLNTNRKLATAVRFKFTDFTEKPEGDTIYYARDRKLTWSDFRGKRRPPGNFGALIMPGLGYEHQAEMVKGIIYVHISMKTFLPKSTCWVDAAYKNEYTLNHEQRHFDVARIIAEQFKQKVLAAKLTPDTFEAFLTMQYLDSYRDMNAMQKSYDGETRHGANRLAQAAWNSRIDKELP